VKGSNYFVNKISFFRIKQRNNHLKCLMINLARFILSNLFSNKEIKLSFFKQTNSPHSLGMDTNIVQADS